VAIRQIGVEDQIIVEWEWSSELVQWALMPNPVEGLRDVKKGCRALLAVIKCVV
jgi:hypothetical protein